MKSYSTKLVWVLVLCFISQELPLMSYNIFSEKCVSEKKPSCWVSEIRDKIIRKYTAKYELVSISISAAMPENVISEVGVGFSIYQVISKEKARQIIVECVQDFIKELNNHPYLKPYFKEYPCTAKNVHAALFIYHPNRESTYYPDLGAASAYNGFIFYTTDDPLNKFKYRTEEKETFEEAIERTRVETSKEDML